MPVIGEMKIGTAIGKNWSHKFVWHSCVSCGKERWVRIVKLSNKNQPMNLHCYSCSNKYNGAHKKHRPL